MKHLLLTAVLLGTASAQNATPLPVVNSQGRSTPGSARPADISSALPDFIRGARQVILYAPDLNRSDIAEAIRLAITQRGTNAYLITSQAPLYLDDSLTLRLALMRVPTYLASAQGVPFVLIDGRAATGPGVTGPGQASWVSAQQATSLAAWVKDATRTSPLNVVSVVREWVRRHGGPPLR